VINLELNTTLLNQLEVITLLAVVVVVIRYILSRFLSSLAQRGSISLSSKALLTRLIDLTLLSAFLIISVNIVTASLTPYAVVIVLGFTVLTLFFYEVKQFAAYIALQMFRHVKGRNAEIYLHTTSEPIKGRIVEISPLTSVIEDFFGNKIYIPNTVLMESVIKELNPSINIRLVLSIKDEDVNDVFNDVRRVFKEVDLGPFRFNDNHVVIKSLNTKFLVVDIRLSSIALPIRNIDILKVLNQLSRVLSKYEPVLEVV
jgi:hypothetical protein